MTEEIFCKLYSDHHGEPIDNIKQISSVTFTGVELKEFVDHAVASEFNKLGSEISGKEFLEGYDPQIKESSYDNYIYSPSQVITRIDSFIEDYLTNTDD